MASDFWKGAPWVLLGSLSFAILGLILAVGFRDWFGVTGMSAAIIATSLELAALVGVVIQLTPDDEP